MFDKPKLLLDNHGVESVRMIFTMPSRLEEAKSLLREAMALETHTPEGCAEFARWAVDTLRRECNGNVRSVVYPPGSALEGEYSNIVVDIGQEGADERLLLQGHFDTVVPHTLYQSEGIASVRSPYELYTDPQHSYLWYGLGGYDMKGGLIATLLAAKYAKLPRHRALRLLWVSREEVFSEGIHAAKQSGLLKDVTCAVTTEIPVGGTLEDHPTLMHGRPGRLAFEIQTRGVTKHRGQARMEERASYAYHRMARVEEAIWHLQVPEGPAYASIYPGRAVLGNVNIESMPGSMSVADIGIIGIDVYSLDPHLNPVAVEKAVRALVAQTLGDDDFGVYPPRERKTPPTPGWYENPEGPFVERMRAIGNSALARQSTYPRELKLGLGLPTADEPLLGVPTVTIQPVGRDEHQAGEVIDGRSIVDLQTPFMIAVAEHPGELAV